MKLSQKCILSLLMVLITITVHSQNMISDWGRTFGSVNRDWAYAIATDAAGNTYTTGGFSGTIDFDPGPSTFNLTSLGNQDIFVLKMDIDGNFVWANSMGGTGYDQGLAIAVDPSNNVYVTGRFGSSPATFGPYTLTRTTSSTDAFITKLDPTGNISWAESFLGTTGDTVGQGIAFAGSEIVVTGYFIGTVDFDPGAGVTSFTTFAAGVTESFIVKLNTSGGLIWADQLKAGTATSNAVGKSVTMDALGNIYAAGTYKGTADFDPGVPVNNLVTPGFTTSTFVLKLDALGNFADVGALEGTGISTCGSASLDGGGNILLSGTFLGTVDFDPGPSTFNLTEVSGQRDIYAVKLDPSLNFVWAKQVGGAGDDRSETCITDASGNLYLTGLYTGTVDFDPGPGVYKLSSAVNYGYVLKLDGNGNFKAAGATGVTWGYGIVLAPLEKVVVAGSLWFSGGDFDPTSGTLFVACVGDFDIAVQKLGLGVTISSFSPLTGPIGTTVTINGLDFDPTPSNNLVFFGATRATVTAASTTQLTVTVPAGATYLPISVTVKGLTAYSQQPFITTFPEGGIINGCAFGPKKDVSTGSGPYSVAIGDIDGDGKSDVITANNGSNRFSVLRNTGNAISAGAYNTTFATKVDFTTFSGPRGVAVADIDGDGKLDVAIAMYTVSRLSVYRNTSTTGTISFDSPITLTTAGNPYKVAIGDLDGDGKPDLVTANFGSASVSVFRNLSSPGAIIAGSFSTPKVDFVTGTNPFNLALHDLNGDKKLEIITVNSAGNTFSVLGNTASFGIIDATSFAAKVDFATGVGSSIPHSIAVGDLDGDGKPDVGVTNSAENTVSVFRNTSTAGAFTFDPHVDLTTAPNPYDISMGDLDGDGKLDLAVTSQSAPIGISILKNTGTGTISFASKVDFSTTSSPYQMAIGDLDGDGKPDVATGNVGASTVSVFRNTISSLPGLTTVNFSPSSGAVGTPVTITGGPFSATPSNNIVVFGTLVAQVISSTPTSIATVVPSGATTGPITVTVGCVTVVSSGNFTLGTISGPTISSFTPTSGAIGTTVTITGTNFSATPANNIVFFGATRTTVSAATSTQLTVTVPSGATYQPISVLVNGLTAYASKPFNVTFADGGVIDACAFAAKVDFTTGIDSYNTAVGDLDNDGRSDVVVANSADNTISIFKNTSTPGTISSGSFAAKIDFTTGTNPLGIFIRDLDGDGKPDIAVVNEVSNTVSIFRNTSATGIINAGSFAAKVDFSTGTSPNDVTIHDFDMDGKPDLAVTNRFSASVSVFRNTSVTGAITTGSFAAKVDFTTGFGPQGIASQDIDGDGKADLAISNESDFSVSVLRNTSVPGAITAGSFAAKVDFTTGPNPVDVAIGDLDGDGKPDLAVSNTDDGTVSILRNTSTSGAINSGSFSPNVDFFSGGGYMIAIDDLDGDGRPDLVTNSDPTKVAVLKNLSTSGAITTGSFGAPVEFATASSNEGIAIGDLDGDGKPDLAAVGATAVSILRNTVSSLPTFTITSNTPNSGPVGTTVIFTGTNFSTTPLNNTIKFNGTTAVVTASTSTSMTTTVPVGATTGPISVKIGCIEAFSIIPFTVTSGITITTQPSNYSACAGPTAILSTAATGTSNITYQWQLRQVDLSFSDIANGSGYAGANTSSLSINTAASFGAGVYRCRINGDLSAEVISNEVGVLILLTPAAPGSSDQSSCDPVDFTLTATGGVNGEYRWYTVATGGTPISGETNDVYITPVLSTSTTYYVSLNNGICEGPRTSVLAEIKSCTPVITAASLQTQIGGQTSLDISPLVTTIDSPVDISSIKIVQQPISGAAATITNGELMVDYAGISFAGTDRLTIEACDLTTHCGQQEFTIEVAGDITVYNAISPNNDGKNDIFYVQYIELLPTTKENTMTIFDRWGGVVFEVNNYDNTTNVFRGLNQNGDQLPTGTYYYKLEFASEPAKTGYISLRR